MHSKKIKTLLTFLIILITTISNIQPSYAVAADIDGDLVPDFRISVSYGTSRPYDWCKTTSGIFQNGGCVGDGDLDGVLTVNDTCPKIGGLNTDGCPTSSTENDTDGDGYTNLNDLCPTVFGIKVGSYGTNDGCPIDRYADMDGDGIPTGFFITSNTIFAYDNCIDVPGIIEFGGCPEDSDLDGISDITDSCDAIKGPLSKGGCGPITPKANDSDGDGILNSVDNCPTEFFAGIGGCPYTNDLFLDTDSDTVRDNGDFCPTVKGEVINGGCPIDYDEDGTEDIYDKCPLILGTIENYGCAVINPEPEPPVEPTPQPKPQPTPKVSINPVSVYRFFNTKNGAHLYTISTEEKNNIQNNLASIWTYEGEKFKVYDQEVVNSKPAHRFFNSKTGAHLYTIDETEKTTIMNTLPVFNYEGVKYYVFELSQSDAILPVYRFFNKKTGSHLYTVDEEEKNTIISSLANFSYEGVKFYVESL